VKDSIGIHESEFNIGGLVVELHRLPHNILGKNVEPLLTAIHNNNNGQ